MAKIPWPSPRSNSPRVPPAAILVLVIASWAAWTAAARGQEKPVRDISRFLEHVRTTTDERERRRLTEDFAEDAGRLGGPVTTDSAAFLFYLGPAMRVCAAGDFNGWNPTADSMLRVAGTDFFYTEIPFPRKGRFEYKIIVDGSWMLDPSNPLRARTGMGENSEVRMPGYTPPVEIEPRTDVRHGDLDTVMFPSRTLGRTHPVIVYTPALVAGASLWGILVVTDGGEYVELARMATVLDNLIADSRIKPILAVFVDPRTDPSDPGSNKRMVDYAMSDAYLSFLAEELLPSLRDERGVLLEPSRTGIMGASMGGLISTYAVFRRPESFRFAGIQSPAYQWDKHAIFDTVRQASPEGLRFYMDTGTIHDALGEARRMRELLTVRGYPVTYGEYPEGHNWSNWRARLPDLLTAFCGAR